MSPTPKLTPPLRALGLRKRYGQTTVVEDVGLSVRPGEVLGLLGPNGAGKTTTFYMLVGLVRPDGGVVRLGEAVITREPIHARAKRGIA
ncbi:MAG: ATP-binding cassette domain-containing protein, partial [Pseudomonadales bacterium]